MRKTSSLFLAATAALLLVSGCSGRVDGPVIEGNRSTGGTDAEVLGVVVIEQDCIFLGQADTRYPVVWPHGTSWDSAEAAIRLPDGTLVYEGDQVYGGGGYHTEANLADFTVAAGVELALRCVDNQ